MKQKIVVLDGDHLQLEELVGIARNRWGVAIAETSKKRIHKARNLVENWVNQGERIYGVTTGFGALSEVTITLADTKRLQKKILLSHAAGMGTEMPEDVVRAMMALRINDFCRGNSGFVWRRSRCWRTCSIPALCRWCRKKGRSGPAETWCPWPICLW